MLELEEHYRDAHTHQCCVCRARFLTFRALDVHTEEQHSPLFATKLSMYPDRMHFECYASATCELRFLNQEERDAHCRNVHHVENGARVLNDGHKLAANLAKTFRNVHISANTPPARFGSAQEQMFEVSRRKLTAKRVLE